MTADELGAWLQLLLAPGLGRERLRRLLATFGSPQAVLAADDSALQALLGPSLTTALRSHPEPWQQALKSSLTWLEKAGSGPPRHLLTLEDAAFPRALLHSPDPPLLLFACGDLGALSAPAVAVVGSRRPTAQGRDHAREFSRRLAEAGFVVTSGLAEGIDAAAHEGALASGALTVAVMGTGIDRVYPAAHRELARRIAAQGLLLTEFTPGTPPLAQNFPQRNRLIAGLAQGTLVVEAALRSGSLITARLANEAGREVFAVPGSVHSAQSRGCHALIRDGAQLVENAAEVIAALRQPLLPGLAAVPAPDVEAEAEADAEDALLQALGQDPVTLDALQARTGEPTSVLLARLLELELAGEAARLPGGLYQRRARRA